MDIEARDPLVRTEPEGRIWKSRYALAPTGWALQRAVFLLRNGGNGPYDNEQADIIEALLLLEDMPKS